ncbi:hypothetical protein BBJ28_00008261 [Nothophytophthora sp. Chile5]|nr:hypothetical protein BBJ28_00008261 [Nothophytophthora sp. Chile5]
MVGIWNLEGCLQATNGQIAARKAKKMDSALSEALRRGNPVVFFDVAIGGAPAGRMRLELFKKDCPRTVENFRGPGTNGCQFFFTCAPCDWLDGKHVVFGKLLDPASLLLLRKMESVPVGPNSKPKLAISVTECGEL